MQFEYLSQVDITTTFTFGGYRIGGLSGIDYDPLTGQYIAESDHGYNGQSNAIYTFTLHGNTTAGGSPSITFQSVLPLTHDDAESVRYDPNGDGYWYTTEDDPPAIYHVDAKGTIVEQLQTPQNVATRFQTNYSFEGSTFTPNGNYFVSVEDSLKRDQAGLTRILQYDPHGKMIAQYAYQLDNLPNIANPPNTLHDSNNGISDILAVDDTHLLVLERGWDGMRANTAPTGVSHDSIRIYEVDLTGAQDVQNIENLTSANTIPLPKTELFDSANLAAILNTYNTKVDNIEGMTWGPNTADGHKTLVLVNDDNYATSQEKTQFITLELDEDAACFLPGTLIDTPDGPVPVERMEPGMLVRTFARGGSATGRVVWTGVRTVRVADDASSVDQWPVRIRRDALAPRLPSQDLLVTGEHCLLLNNRFVPARMLVNGASIVVERSMRSYTVHHIETEQHTVVAANGVLTETYLDTGNRRSFTRQRGVVALRRAPLCWERDAAAALATERHQVEPIWRSLVRRATRLGFVLPTGQALEYDPVLLVEGSDGTILRAVDVQDGTYRFVLTPGSSQVTLRSRSARPADTIGPFVDDRRSLGVLVGKIAVLEAGLDMTVTNHLCEEVLAGWHDLAPDCRHLRWTNGCAVLPLGAAGLHGGYLKIEIVTAGPYLAKDFRQSVMAQKV